MTFGRDEGLLPKMNDSERPIVDELYGPFHWGGLILPNSCLNLSTNV